VYPLRAWGSITLMSWVEDVRDVRVLVSRGPFRQMWV